MLWFRQPAFILLFYGLYAISLFYSPYGAAVMVGGRAPIAANRGNTFSAFHTIILLLGLPFFSPNSKKRQGSGDDMLQ